MNSAATTGTVCDRPVPARLGLPGLLLGVLGVPGVPDDVVVAGVCVADSAAGVGEFCAAMALVSTVMLPSAASGSVSPVTAFATPVTNACSASTRALTSATTLFAAVSAACAAASAASAETALAASVAMV